MIPSIHGQHLQQILFIIEIFIGTNTVEKYLFLTLQMERRLILYHPFIPYDIIFIININSSRMQTSNFNVIINSLLRTVLVSCPYGLP